LPAKLKRPAKVLKFKPGQNSHENKNENQTLLTANKKIYFGLFFICLSTLMFELLMPRIWSVSMWYHFAFVAISMAMLGITVGSLAVYVFPGYFSDDNCGEALAKASLAFALAIVFSLLTQLCIPFFPDRSLTGFYSLALILLMAALPFALSGICVALILSKFSQQAGKLYSFDLLGAACGCLVVLWILNVTDGPTAVMFSACTAALGSVAFALNSRSQKLLKASCWLTALLLLFVAGNTFLVYKQSSLIRLIWVKAKFEERPLYEKWNSFSRVTVSGDKDQRQEPYGWGFSPAFDHKTRTRQLDIFMDAFNATVLPYFQGDFNEVDYLRWDITNIAHYLRHNASVLIIGTGGGRDILSALLFKQKSIVGVEINENVINATTKQFADFSGHLDSYPQVKFVNDEARSYIGRQTNHFDIIQMSIIDTASTTSSGAIALTENSLYTKEAWQLFLKKLNPGGIISCSRWYCPQLPAETDRLVSVAASALKANGVADPSSHLIVVKPRFSSYYDNGTTVATLLASSDPFTKEDLQCLKAVCTPMQFDIVLCPDCKSDPTLLAIAKQESLNSLQAQLPINIMPATDNSPFFFYFLKLLSPVHPDTLGSAADQLYGRAQLLIFQLLIAVSFLSLLGIAWPLFWADKKADFWQGLPLLGYFLSIGSGFMLVEVSQMQRFIIFLGHPSYSLSVVLFTLLLASGAGSYLTYWLPKTKLPVSPMILIALLLFCLIVFGIFSQAALDHYVYATTPVRALVAALLLAPLGLVMGMAVPIGIQAAGTKSQKLIPWLWAVNGAASVVASVVAVAISISFGIAQAYFTGIAFYFFAALVVARQSLRKT
jgi:hypothetical protein